MSKISHYEKLIQEKRKKTPFRDFVKELGSWEALNLYRRNGRICRYPETDRVKKLGDNFWIDASSCGRDYDFSESFFSNFQSLQDSIPLDYILSFGSNENCDFADCTFQAKNVYLSFVIGLGAEDILYSACSWTNISRVMNSFLVTMNSSEVINSIGVSESGKIFYSKNITNSSDIWFSTNLIGCHDCIACDGLENADHMINNVKYDPDEYTLKHNEILRKKEDFPKIWKHIHQRPITNFASKNVEGSGVSKSSNVEGGLWASNIHNSRNIVVANGEKGSINMFDVIDTGNNASNIYATMGCGGPSAQNVYCSYQINNSGDVYYSANINDSHHCIGCMGLKNKSYCIFNKQYTKEEWEVLADKILSSMEVDGSLGEFFPGSMNPFYFNDTLAYVIDDTFTREEVEKDGYLWRDEPIRADIPDGLEVVKSTELDHFQGFDTDGKWNIDPSILDKVITDTGNNSYRIVKMEYDFLMKHALPLPTMHWLDRIKMGFR